MFFILSKLLNILINPLVWVIVLLFLAIIGKNKKRKRRRLILGFVMLLFFSNQQIAQWAMQIWEIENTVDASKRRYTYAVVLGGMTGYNTNEGVIQFREASDRLLQVLPLFYSGQVDTILLTGGSGKLLNNDRREATLLANYLSEIKFPTDRLLVESQSRNTYENAIYTKAMLSDSTTRFLLSTSAFHMRRSKACFDKQGLQYDHFSTDFFTESSSYFVDTWIIPDYRAILAWQLLIKEMAGMIAYKIVGYI